MWTNNLHGICYHPLHWSVNTVQMRVNSSLTWHWVLKIVDHQYLPFTVAQQQLWPGRLLPELRLHLPDPLHGTRATWLALPTGMRAEPRAPLPSWGAGCVFTIFHCQQDAEAPWGLQGTREQQLRSPNEYLGQNLPPEQTTVDAAWAAELVAFSSCGGLSQQSASVHTVL